MASDFTGTRFRLCDPRRCTASSTSGFLRTSTISRTCLFCSCCWRSSPDWPRLPGVPGCATFCWCWPRSRPRCVPCATFRSWCWSSSLCSARWPRPGCRSGEPCDGPARRYSAWLRAPWLFNLLCSWPSPASPSARVRQVVGRQAETEARHFPAAAAAFLQQEHPPGPMMNHYNWGGYFIWKLYPQYRVFMDGRADVYGDTLMTEFGSCYYLTAIGENPSQTWGIRTVVLPPDAPLITALRSSPKWRADLSRFRGRHSDPATTEACRACARRNQVR